MYVQQYYNMYMILINRFYYFSAKAFGASVLNLLSYNRFQHQSVKYNNNITLTYVYLVKNYIVDMFSDVL